jgi:hypothetical protein
MEATIGCANLHMKQGWADDYIPSSLTSSNNGWQKGWFLLRNDPESELPAFTGNSIGQLEKLDQRPHEDGAGKDAQGPLGGAGVSPRSRGLPIHQHMAVPCPRSCAAPKAVALSVQDDSRPPPWTGTVTTPTLLSPLEIQHRMAQAIGKVSYSWPPAWLLPMLPHEGTERLVSRCFLR